MYYSQLLAFEYKVSEMKQCQQPVTTTNTFPLISLNCSRDISKINIYLNTIYFYLG